MEVQILLSASTWGGRGLLDSFLLTGRCLVCVDSWTLHVRSTTTTSA